MFEPLTADSDLVLRGRYQWEYSCFLCLPDTLFWLSEKQFKVTDSRKFLILTSCNSKTLWLARLGLSIWKLLNLIWWKHEKNLAHFLFTFSSFRCVCQVGTPEPHMDEFCTRVTWNHVMLTDSRDILWEKVCISFWYVTSCGDAYTSDDKISHGGRAAGASPTGRCALSVSSRLHENGSGREICKLIKYLIFRGQRWKWDKHLREG